MTKRGLRITLLAMGLYYIVTGLWPLVHVDSFVYVVGPKPDRFQLDVTASLIVVIGVILLLGGVQRRPQSGIVLLGILAASALAVMALAYAPILRNVFWLDVAVELAFALLLAWFGIVRR